MNETGNQPTKEELQAFVDNNFEAEGLEFQIWNPSDWISDPPFLSQVNNSELRDWGNRLHEGWKSLGRHIKGDLKMNRVALFISSLNTIRLSFHQISEEYLSLL